MNHVTMHVKLEIKYEYDPNKNHDIEQDMKTTVELAVQPNYGTIDSGVHLLSVIKGDPQFFYQTLNHRKQS